jgi:hypothetical protein
MTSTIKTEPKMGVYEWMDVGTATQWVSMIRAREGIAAFEKSWESNFSRPKNLFGIVDGFLPRAVLYT